MRVLLFLALGTALAIALPQNDQTRRRGLRRFSLASPGLQSSARRQEATQDVAEPTVAAEEATPAETPQRVRGRGASLLRRGRPSRLRSPQVETAAVQEQVDEKVVEAPPQRQAGGRGSIRIRRPIRKPTKKTTTTTTTTSAPVTEDLITSPENPEAEISVDGSMQKDETEGTQSQIETKQMPADEMKKDITDVTKTKAEKAEAKPTKQIGPKLKLRPIPIKSARKNIKEETPEEVPAAPKDVTPTDQETTSSISEPVSSHRFSSRPKPPRIQSRRRQSAAVVPKPVPVQQTEIISDPVEAPVRQRLGGRGPTLRRPSSRLSPRGRNKIQSEEPAPEIVEETVGVEGAAAERPSTLSRSERFFQRKREG